MTDADSLAELAAQAPKQPEAYFLIKLKLQDVDYVDQGDGEYPECSFQGMDLEPATGIDYGIVSLYYTEKKRGD